MLDNIRRKRPSRASRTGAGDENMSPITKKVAPGWQYDTMEAAGMVVFDAGIAVVGVCM